MHNVFPAATHASTAPTGANVELLLLGPAQSTCNGAPLAFPYDKVQALLIYLAVEAKHAHRRSALAGLLWPDQPEGAARHSLTAGSRLKLRRFSASS